MISSPSPTTSLARSSPANCTRSHARGSVTRARDRTRRGTGQPVRTGRGGPGPVIFLDEPELTSVRTCSSPTLRVAVTSPPSRVARRGVPRTRHPIGSARSCRRRRAARPRRQDAVYARERVRHVWAPEPDARDARGLRVDGSDTRSRRPSRGTRRCALCRSTRSIWICPCCGPQRDPR